MAVEGYVKLWRAIYSCGGLCIALGGGMYSCGEQCIAVEGHV